MKYFFAVIFCAITLISNAQKIDSTTILPQFVSFDTIVTTAGDTIMDETLTPFVGFRGVVSSDFKGNYTVSPFVRLGVAHYYQINSNLSYNTVIWADLGAGGNNGGGLITYLSYKPVQAGGHTIGLIPTLVGKVHLNGPLTLGSITQFRLDSNVPGVLPGVDAYFSPNGSKNARGGYGFYYGVGTGFMAQVSAGGTTYDGLTVDATAWYANYGSKTWGAIVTAERSGMKVMATASSSYAGFNAQSKNYLINFYGEIGFGYSKGVEVSPSFEAGGFYEFKSKKGFINLFLQANGRVPGFGGMVAYTL